MGKTVIAVNLEDDVISWLDVQCKKVKMSRSGFVEYCLQQSMKFSGKLMVMFHDAFNEISKDFEESAKMGDETK
jgi:hypothetical protein